MQEEDDQSIALKRSSVALVLGAGASRNYGFPTGWELAQKLLECPSPPNHAPPGYGNPHIYDEFRIEFRSFLDEGGKSIDAFLGSDRGARFLLPARLAMSLIISEHEIEEQLLTPRSTEDHWYPLLYERLTKGRTWASLDLSEVPVITFNYDRSLERYLYLSLQKDFETSEFELSQKIRALDVTHVYGAIGEAWPGDGHEMYAPRTGTDQYAIATRRLKLIGQDGDSRSAQETQKLIRAKLSVADTICFLGFGYDPDNLKVLGFPPVNQGTDLKRIVGTAYCLTESQKAQALTQIGPHASLHDTNCLTLLREECIFL